MSLPAVNLQGKRHIPYRDSKLTRLLQSSLSGNAHMAIITTISPAAGSVDNTKAALHFATAAGRVIMKPQVNQVASNKALIKAMAAEIQQLKAQLVSQCGTECLLVLPCVRHKRCRGYCLC